jgi:hypothetical protein
LAASVLSRKLKKFWADKKYLKNIFDRQMCSFFDILMTSQMHATFHKNMNLQGFAKVNASQGPPNLISLKKM